MVGVQVKNHNSSCSKMSRSEQSWSSRAELEQSLSTLIKTKENQLRISNYKLVHMVKSDSSDLI